MVDISVIREGVRRSRGNIFSAAAGMITKIDKNAAGTTIGVTSYDAQTSLLEELNPSQLNVIKLTSDSDDNFYFVGDLIAVRQEDSTAEPLGSTKEEFRTITNILTIEGGLQLTLSSVLANTYTLALCKIYNVIKNDKYAAGLDRTVSTTEMWRTN